MAEVLDDSPLGFYLLAEPSGTVAEDASGNGRDGVHVADPIRLGCATSYDGAADDTELGNAALALSVAGGTIEAWLWLNEEDRYAILRDHSGEPAGDNGWLLLTDVSGGLGEVDEILYRIGGTEFFTGVPISSVKDQQWRHFAMTWDAAESRYFIQGLLVHTDAGPASNPSPGPGTTPVALPWHVGRNGEFLLFNTMRAARVAFFGSKLSDARIAEHAKGAPPCGGGWIVGAAGIG